MTMTILKTVEDNTFHLILRRPTIPLAIRSIIHFRKRKEHKIYEECVDSLLDMCDAEIREKYQKMFFECEMEDCHRVVNDLIKELVSQRVSNCKECCKA